MFKRPFLADAQQELYFLPKALQALEAGKESGRPASELLEAAIENHGLDGEHLEGLGLFGADGEVDENGHPVPPPWDAVLPAMAVDCLDQLRLLKLIDEGARLTPDGRRCMDEKNFASLQRAVRDHYSIEGGDGVERPVVAQMAAVYAAFAMLGTEREEDPFSVVYRPGLCLAEFMRLHFWMQELKKAPVSRHFAGMLVKERREDLRGKDVENDDIDWAAFCMAGGAGHRLEALYGEQAIKERIVAVRSTALMLCHAGFLTFDGLPGELQWIRPTGLMKKMPAGRRGRKGTRS